MFVPVIAPSSLRDLTNFSRRKITRFAVAAVIAVTTLISLGLGSPAEATFHSSCATGAQGCVRFWLYENNNINKEYGYTNLPYFPGDFHWARMDHLYIVTGSMRNRGLTNQYFIVSGGQDYGGLCAARQWDGYTWMGYANPAARWVAKAQSVPSGCFGF